MNKLLASLIVGALVGGAPTFFVTKAVFQRATLKAKTKLAETKTALAEARANVLAVNTQLSAVLLEERDAEQTRLDGIAGTLDSLSRGMSTCARKSDVRITTGPERIIETVRGGELRDLADVVRDFANSCAVGRDRDAIDHNKLIDWLERLPKELEATP